MACEFPPGLYVNTSRGARRYCRAHKKPAVSRGRLLCAEGKREKRAIGDAGGDD